MDDTAEQADTSGAQSSAETAGPPPLLPELSSSAATVPAPFDADATGAVEPTDWAGILQNRLILSGLAVIVVLALITIVLVTIGNGDGDPRPRSLASGGTPEASPTALPGGSLVGEVLTTTTIRSGPGSTYPILGTVPRGALVSVVGRDENQAWLQVSYPPGSELLGWVSIAFIEVSGDVSRLVVAKAGEPPSIVIPTSIVIETPTALPAATEPLAPTEMPSPEPEKTPPPTETSLPTVTPEATSTSPPPEIETPTP